MKNDIWFIYILECFDGTYYTGATNNVEARVNKHNNKKGAKYTMKRLPVKLMYFEECGTKSDAYKREYAIKQLSRKEKENLWKTKE